MGWDGLLGGGADPMALGLRALSAAARVAPVVLLAPFLGAGIVPGPLLLVLVALLLAAALPLLPVVAPPAAAPTLVDLAALTAAELLVGLALGFAVALVFHAARAAGWLAGRAAGEAPTLTSDGGPYARLYLMLSLVIFAAIGGHRLALAGLLASYDLVAPGQIPGGLALAGAAGVALRLSGDLFTIALALAAPVIGATLLADIAVAWVLRLAPGAAVGRGAGVLRRAAGLGAILVAAGALVAILPELLARAVAALDTMARALAG